VRVLEPEDGGEDPMKCALCEGVPKATDAMTEAERHWMAGAAAMLTQTLIGGISLCVRHAAILASVLEGVKVAHEAHKAGRIAKRGPAS
jgi:hypothetical protein